jgi:hypothetical protein
MEHNTVFIEDIGEIVIPPRNTKGDILEIVRQFRERDDLETLHDLFMIVPLKKENIWCLHDDCIESVHLFKNELERNSHTMAIHGRKKWY